MLLTVARPEKARYVLLECLHDRVLFHQVELTQKFMRQQGVKVSEGQMNGFWLLGRAQDRLVNATARRVRCLAYDAHVDVLPIRRLRVMMLRRDQSCRVVILANRAFISDKLLLIDSHGLPGAPAE